MTFSVQLAETKLRPGASLAGEVVWDAATAPAEIGLTLLWYTVGKGDEDAETVAQQTLRVQEHGGRLPFRFELPDFPWSFSGGLISLVWAVEASAGQDGVERVSFVLAPEGEEVRL